MLPSARKTGPAESKLTRTCVRASVISQFSNSAAGSGDLVAGGGGKPVRADLQRDRDLALAEHLDQLTLADRAPGGRTGATRTKATSIS